MDSGFVEAGFRLVWANDFDPFAVATHRALLGHAAVAGDIDTVAWPDPGSADVVVGGPPCQGFSVAGKMDPDDPRSRHVTRFFDLVEHVDPRAFVMENVKALAVNGRWAHVLHALEARARGLGYDTKLMVLRAVDYGVPQRRERMFLVGVRDGVAPSAPSPSVSTPVSVREAFATLPAFGEPGNRTFCTARITAARRPVLRPTAYRGSLLFNGNGRVLDPGAPAPTLPASMGGNATPIVDQRQLDTGEDSWVVAYHRMLLRGGRVAERVPATLRRITIEEAAALQTFPTGMEWHGPQSARYRQIGNAVPPLLARRVAEVVLEALNSRVVAPLAA